MTISKPGLRRWVCWLLALPVACILPGVAAGAGSSATLLNPLFQDHAVLQRDHADPVWGTAKPRAELTITFAGHVLHARADADGHWQARLPALPAGGPYTLAVGTAYGETRTIHDVLVGDVWLCAGQSNMVLPVWRTLNQRVVIQNSQNDRIRMLTVDDVASAAPLQAIPATDHWLGASPATVRNFSATCYYFARALQRKVDVPMGLVVTAWGGSRIEPWMSAAALRGVGGHGPQLDLLAAYARDKSQAGQAWGRRWQAWWQSHAGTAKAPMPWSLDSLREPGWKPAPLARGAWQHWGIASLANFTGMLWYRTTVTLTPAQAAQAAVLKLFANETDQTFVNGHWVGSTFGGSQRAYPVPRGVLRAGTNLIAVNVLDTFEEGGVQGADSTRVLQLADGTRIPLANHWEYRVVPSSMGSPPSAPWDPVAGVSALYNGMVAPLGDYGVRGLVWYQGASNTGDPRNYLTLLEALRRQYRAQFGASLPMLIVQLSSFGPMSTHPGPSGWADIREAQRLAAKADPLSALAVSVDIGERFHFIHPADKEILGDRLVRAAMHVAYGDRTLAPSGPVPVSATRSGDAVTVTFGDVTGKLVSYSTDHPISFELCGSQPDSCQYAVADLHGNRVTLRAPVPAGTVDRVRYCWADSPLCTLYDDSGLPAGPFEMRIDTNVQH